MDLLVSVIIQSVILIVVDPFSKICHYVPFKKLCTPQELFAKEVFTIAWVAKRDHLGPWEKVCVQVLGCLLLSVGYSSLLFFGLTPPVQPGLGEISSLLCVKSSRQSS